MDAIRQGDAQISGSGRISGGMYKNISISGSGQMDGNVDAFDVRISGSAEVHGNLKASSVKASGSAAIRGNMEAGECKFSGSGRVDGYSHMRSLSTSGSFVGGAGVRAEHVKASGGFKVAGDVEAETFSSSGGMTIDGLLNASEVTVKMHGKCYSKEIGGDRISITEAAPWNVIWKLLSSVVPFWKIRMESELIEGTDVFVENTTAQVVRGNHVKIGEGCEIDLVEYTGTLHVDPHAKVLEIREV